VLLKQARASNKVVHVATVNVRLDATLAFAKSLARDTHGLFHAFSGSLDDAARNTGLGDCTADSEEIVALRVEVFCAEDC
jgi:Tat protein secretion system quality control protein TatD with DNase activity